MLGTQLPTARIAEATNRLAQEILRHQNDDVTLRVGDAAWVAPDLEVKPTYAALLARQFGAPLAKVDFTDAEAARTAINRWGSQITDGLVKEAVPPGQITPDTKLVLADAVFLDAAWEQPFDPGDTSKQPFTRPDGSTVDAPMMQENGSAPRITTMDYSAIRLPYKGEDLSFIAIMPLRPLAQFVATLTPRKLNDITGAIVEGGIHLSFPRFKFSSTLPLTEPLTELGMPTAFSDSADFSGIASGLFLDFVQQGAAIEVDEKGTKAAAVSTGSFAASHGPTIDFNRPFLYLIRDDATGAVLFIGHVTDPTKS